MENHASEEASRVMYKIDKQVLCLLLLLIGFSSETLSQQITFYTNRADLIDSGHFSRWVKQFKQQQPNISVQVQALERYNQEMSARISRGDYGDVLLIPSNLPAFAWPTYFSSLNDFLAEDELYFAQRWRQGGQRYGVALGVNVEGLIYNKRVFNDLQLDAPRTLSEFFSVAQTITRSERTAIALNIGAAWPLQQWEKTALLIAEDGNYFHTIANDASPFDATKPYGKALAIAHTIFNRGLSEHDVALDSWEQSKQAFAHGELAMLYMGSWLIPQLRDAGADANDIGFVAFPIDESHKPRALLDVNWGIAINKHSKHQTAAREWVKYLLYDSDYAAVSGYLPTLKRREPELAQLRALFDGELSLIQIAKYDAEFLRLANKCDLEFLQGNSTRNILLNPNFDFSLRYWNEKWRLARKG